MIVVTGATGRGPAGERPGSVWALAERAIAACGAAWTFLRPTGFASNTLMWADQIGPATWSAGRSAPPPGP